jgi:hypothetical protein
VRPSSAVAATRMRGLLGGKASPATGVERFVAAGVLADFGV